MKTTSSITRFAIVMFIAGVFIGGTTCLVPNVAWALQEKGEKKNGKGAGERKNDENRGKEKQPGRPFNKADDELPKLNGRQTAKSTTFSKAVALPRLHKYSVATISPGYYKFEADKVKNGHVKVSLGKARTSENRIRKHISEQTSEMCLTKEEVSGARVENELVIADGSMSLEILPGGVIDTNELIRSGTFVYVNMDKRRPYHVSTTSNLARKTETEIKAARRGGINESEARAEIMTLTKPSNFKGMPNVESIATVQTSTFSESMGVDVGASFFYMGISAKSTFGFSSERYQFMYMFQFEQTFLPILADGIQSPDDLFVEPVDNNNEWAYIREVKYGRRLYVLIESEYDLEKYSSEVGGKVTWGAVSAALSTSTRGSSLQESTNVRIVTHGGQPVTLTDPAKLQKTLDDYFEKDYSENDITPLSYKLTYLDGTPLSIETEAFLDSNNCLKSDRIRVHLREVALDESNHKDGEKLYGGARIMLHDTKGNVVAIDGRTPLPPVSPAIPTTTLSFATKEVPLELKVKGAKTYDVDAQGRYIDLPIDDLDMAITIVPVLYEKQTLTDADHQTNDEFKRQKIRDMLLRGNTSKTFELQTDNSKTRMVFDLVLVD